MRTFVILPLLLPLLVGCGVPTTADWRRCTFDVTDVAFRGLRNDQAEWRVTVAAVNPNGKRLKLEGLHLWAVMEGDTLAMLNNPGRIELSPHDTTRLSLDVSVPHTAWNRALSRMRRTGSGEILITGDVEAPTLFGTRRIRNAVRERHTIDLASILGGGDFLRGLFR
jgi:hypothetical protein